MSEPCASLVESIPTGMENLRSTSGVQFTEHALVRLTEATQSTIHLTAMYWALLPDPTSDDEKGFEESDFTRMGAGAGQKLYEALYNAAARGVTIHILQSPGFSKSQQKGESERLRDKFPDDHGAIPDAYASTLLRWAPGTAAAASLRQRHGFRLAPKDLDLR